MSLFSQTLLLYLVIGIGVAGAVYLSGRPRARESTWFRVASAVPFWPLYLPILLAGGEPGLERAPEPAACEDDMSTIIRQVDAELQAALGSLDGWAEDVLARERDRIHELRVIWTAQAERIRQIDRLLALPEYADDENADGPLALAAVGPVAERILHSRQARRQNLERLSQLRRRASEDLMGSLAWVRELVSMIHLAKFTGAPPSRAEELVAQVAAAVEGLSEVTWGEELTVS
jgi:hypothetical protein